MAEGGGGGGEGGGTTTKKTQSKPPTSFPWGNALILLLLKGGIFVAVSMPDNTCSSLCYSAYRHPRGDNPCHPGLDPSSSGVSAVVGQKSTAH